MMKITIRNDRRQSQSVASNALSLRRPFLVIMLKEPRPGRVKTRLGKDIGMGAAAWWYRHQSARLLREVQDPRWQVILALTPDRAGAQSRIWPAHLPRIAQGAGDLGARMGRLMRALPQGPVCIIGSDIPALRRAHIARAFQVLRGQDAVFGPAADGGYWLIGLKRVRAVPAGFLHNVRWSSAAALSDSIATLPGARVALIDTLRDIDTAADLAETRYSGLRRPSPVIGTRYEPDAQQSRDPAVDR